MFVVEDDLTLAGCQFPIASHGTSHRGLGVTGGIIEPSPRGLALAIIHTKLWT